MDWQPIVTMPTDGTEALIKLADDSVWIGRFKWPEGHWQIGKEIPNAHKVEGVCGMPDQIVPHTMMLWGRLREGRYPTHWKPRN